jgi:myosin heavy subunit
MQFDTPDPQTPDNPAADNKAAPPAETMETLAAANKLLTTQLEEQTQKQAQLSESMDRLATELDTERAHRQQLEIVTAAVNHEQELELDELKSRELSRVIEGENKQIAQQQQHIQQLETVVASYTNGDLATRANSLFSENSDLRTEREYLQNSLTSMQSAHDQMMEGMRLAYNQTQQNNKKIQDDHDQFKDMHEDACTELADTKKQLQSSQEVNRQLDSQMHDINIELTDTKKRLQTSTLRYKSFSNLEGINQEISTQLRDLNMELETLYLRADKQEDTIRTQQQLLDEAEQKLLDQHNDMMDGFQQEIQQTRQGVTLLHSQLSNQKSINHQITKELNEFKYGNQSTPHSRDPNPGAWADNRLTYQASTKTNRYKMLQEEMNGLRDSVAADLGLINPGTSNHRGRNSEPLRLGHIGQSSANSHSSDENTDQ